MRCYEGDQRRGTKTEKQASHRDGIIRKPLHGKTPFTSSAVYKTANIRVEPIKIGEPQLFCFIKALIQRWV